MGGMLRYVIVALVSAAVALGASHLARGLMPEHHGSELHQLMHDRLDLSPPQQQAIDRIEADFAKQRTVLDQKLRASNALLARAIETEHRIGPEVTSAVDASHMAMGELQKATLAHVFAMRAVLTPEQQAIFDREIARALTAPDHR
ncbi:protein refolding chaperone Spy/CpxP family [Novosphingobium sp. B1]|nr:periplasmic heavy metal sensor [Novosphingobium sp. B1]SMC97810.1 protein refolding chaperone Spy/CpxP family [Novosphingobium sp. B1]